MSEIEEIERSWNKGVINNTQIGWLIEKVRETERIAEDDRNAAIHFQKSLERMEVRVKSLEAENKDLKGKVSAKIQDYIADYEDLEAELSREKERSRLASEEIGRLEEDLALNAKMLARQCDLARGAETEAMKANRRVKALEEGIRKHETSLANFYPDNPKWYDVQSELYRLIEKEGNP